MHDVAPSAVSIADAIDTMICAMNFAVSFLVITYLLSLRINHWRNVGTRVTITVLVLTAILIILNLPRVARSHSLQHVAILVETSDLNRSVLQDK